MDCLAALRGDCMAHWVVDSLGHFETQVVYGSQPWLDDRTGGALKAAIVASIAILALGNAAPSLALLRQAGIGIPTPSLKIGV